MSLPTYRPLPAVPCDTAPSLVASVGYRDGISAGRLRHRRFRFTADPIDAVTVAAEGPR